MHASRFRGSIVLGMILTLAAFDAGAAVVGTGEADSQGNCLIEFAVDPEVNPTAVAEQLTDALDLSGAATVSEILVENGVAQVKCKRATPGSSVEASLPDELYAALAPKPPPGVAPAAVAGGVAIGATGIGLGTAAAAGAFDGDSRDGTMSPEQ